MPHPCPLLLRTGWGKSALSEDEVNLMEVTPTDIDLMEIRQHKGPEAVWKRIKQLDAAEQRRYQRAQKQLAHCRHVVRAAAQNAARETYFVAKSEAAVAAAEAAETAEQAEKVGEQAGAPPLTGAGAPPLSPTAGERVAEGNPAGAPPLSPSAGDRVGTRVARNRSRLRRHGDQGKAGIVIPLGSRVGANSGLESGEGNSRPRKPF